MSTAEEWRAIPTWEGFYEVSNLGRVRSVDREIWAFDRNGELNPRFLRGKVLAAGTLKNGYLMVSFTAPAGRREYRYVHDLVTLAFLGPRPERHEVCHENGVRADCRLDNLRYDTRSNNALDRHKHGTMNLAKGEDHFYHKLTEDAVRHIRASRISRAKLAEMYGVSLRTVDAARYRISWKHVT